MSELKELIAAVRSYLEYEKESGIEEYFSDCRVMAANDSGLMFLWEAPGEEEADRLLIKIIEAMGMRREDVYIANILKYRPSNNREQLPDEVQASLENLRIQIAKIKPKVICTLGRFASQALLKTDQAIESMRGNVYTYEGITVVPTFSPEHLLNNPQDKRLVWEDMKKIQLLIASIVSMRDKG